MSIDLEAINARTLAASPGPWIRERSGVIIEIQSGRFIAAEDGIEDPFYAGEPDGEFVAHAREDVPALVAEVERLQKIIAGIRDRARIENERCDSDVAYLAEINDGESIRRVQAEQYAWTTMLAMLHDNAPRAGGLDQHSGGSRG